MISLEERFAGRVGLDDPAVVLEHCAYPLPYSAVVVDDENDRGLPVGGRRFARLQTARGRGAIWHSQEPLDRLRQLLGFNRLVELHAVPKRYIAQCVGRYVAGQNDDRDMTMDLLAQPGGDFEPVHAVW